MKRRGWWWRWRGHRKNRLLSPLHTSDGRDDPPAHIGEDESHQKAGGGGGGSGLALRACSVNCSVLLVSGSNLQWLVKFP